MSAWEAGITTGLQFQARSKNIAPFSVQIRKNSNWLVRVLPRCVPYASYSRWKWQGCRMLAWKVSAFCSANDDTNVLPPSWTLKLAESWGEPKSDWQVRIEEGKAPPPLVFLLLSIFDRINNQSLIPSTDVIQLTLNLKMTTARVVETSVTVNNSPIQDYVHADDHTQPTFEMTPGFKPFTAFKIVAAIND